MNWNILRFFPRHVPADLPKPRAKRPNRRDHGGLTSHPDSLPWRTAVTETLEQFGFTREAIEDAIYAINDAWSYREHRPSGLLRESDEKEDLAELRVRLGDVLDSLHAMSNTTRCRILDVLRPAGLGADPLRLEGPLRELQHGVDMALSGLSNVQQGPGRPPYDDVRETPFLAALMVIWFDQFPNDAGITRRGDYKSFGLSAEYAGRMLDFLMAMYQAVCIAVSSPGAVGKRAFNLQDRIRADLAKKDRRGRSENYGV